MHFFQLSDLLPLNSGQNERLEVDFSSNKIDKIDLSGWNEYSQSKGKIKLVLDTIICNCVLYDSLEELSSNGDLKNSIEIDLKNTFCQEPNGEKGQSLDTLDMPQNCSASADCPEKCKCILNRNQKLYHVNCSKQDYKELPNIRSFVRNNYKLYSIDFSYNKLEK